MGRPVYWTKARLERLQEQLHQLPRKEVARLHNISIQGLNNVAYRYGLKVRKMTNANRKIHRDAATGQFKNPLKQDTPPQKDPFGVPKRCN